MPSGVINGTAPNPVRLAEMCEHLGNVMGRPSWLPVPDFALKAVLGEGASVVRISSSLLLNCLMQNPIFAKINAYYLAQHIIYMYRFLKGKEWFQLEQRS